MMVTQQKVFDRRQNAAPANAIAAEAISRARRSDTPARQPGTANPYLSARFS